MDDNPWTGDACSLVDAFRSKELSPLEALESCLAAIERSQLNAFSYLDPERAREAARNADVKLPFGGVPIGVKELEHVSEWPYSEASLVFKDRKSDFDATAITRLRKAGAVLAGQTTASEFGGVNCTTSRLHGTTRNPWSLELTPGGSSGGSAAAVSGGLIPIATGSDGGGSIRIPAGFTGTFGLKATFGRIPRGPQCENPPLTVTLGCLSRSVRDTARWFDVCNGYDAHDTLSLPRVGSWEAELGTFDLTDYRVAVVGDLGGAVVSPAVMALVEDAASSLISSCRLKRTEVKIELPVAGFEWAMSNLVSLMATLGDLYPGCEQDLTPEIQLAMNIAHHSYNLELAGSVERFRTQMNEAMASVFDQVDLLITATNPDVAFDAAGPMRTTVAGRDLVAESGLVAALSNNGALTFPANLTGVPAVSIPIGSVNGLPVGMQIIASHHKEQILLDLALSVERERPWPLVAPSSPL